MEKKENFEIGKKNAALEAVKFVEKNMILGLGTGSTANWFIRLLAKKCESTKLNIKCVCTSSSTETLAKKLGFELFDLNDVKSLDLTVDGTDEFDKNKNLIKGGGGALLQEKIVAASSKKMIVISDETKSSKMLGSFPLPVEIVKFGYKNTINKIQKKLGNLGFEKINFSLRLKEKDKFITDEKHFIVDLSLKKIINPILLHQELLLIPGVVETGLFINMADIIIVGSKGKETLFLN